MKTLKQEFFDGLLILSIVMLWRSNLIFISATLLGYILITPIYITIMNRFNPQGVLINEKVKASKSFYFYLAVGLVINSWALFNKINNPESQNIIGKVVIGTFFLLHAFINTEKYLFVITRRSVIFSGRLQLIGWKLRNINQIVLSKDRIEFTKSPQVMEFELQNGKQTLNNISKFLNDIQYIEITNK
jgi:hypothetical protein